MTVRPARGPATGYSAADDRRTRSRRRSRSCARRQLLARRQARGAVGPGRGPARRRQPLAELFAAPVQPGHHGADRRAHHLGDLLVGIALDVGEVDRHPELLRQVAQRPQHVGVSHPVERLGLGRGRGRAQRVGADLPVLLEVDAEGLDRLAPLPPVVVDEGVRQDPVQPGPQIRARLELVERCVGLDECLLDQIFGVAGIPRHSERGRIKLTKVGHHVLFETCVLFWRPLLSPASPLRPCCWPPYRRTNRSSRCVICATIVGGSKYGQNGI